MDNRSTGNTPSLLQQINDDEGMMALMQATLEAVPKLERIHTVRISKVAVCFATYLTHSHFSQTLSRRQLEEKAIDILNSGCLLLRDEINNRADEKRIDELEYILSRCMVESAELLTENPKCKQWLARVDKEYKQATAAITKFVKTWKPILAKSSKRSLVFGPYIIELFQKHLAALPACISSACQTGDFSDCYHELRKLDSLSAKIEKTLPTKFFLEQVMTLDRRHIGEVVSRLIGIPVPVLPTYGSMEVTSLGDRLHERVVDQDGAIDAIYRSIFNNSPCRPDWEKRPRASLLFLGPSGVGKTEVAKCIAEVFFRATDRLVRVDMSKYVEPLEEHWFQWLVETISKKPHSLILFDKIEKSHLDAMETLILDITRGKLSNKDGCYIDLSNTIVIITSHVGAEMLTSLCKCNDVFRRQVESYPVSMNGMHECSSKTSAKDRVLEEAKTIFSTELLNSLDGTIVFGTFDLGIENVTRHIMREKARVISGDKLVVYPSNHVLDVVSNNYCRQPGKAGKAIKSWLEENVIPLLCGIVGEMADKHNIIYIETLVGTEELSFRLAKTDIPEEWMAKHFNLSLRKFRCLYQMDKAVVDGFLQLRNCLSLLLNPIGSKGDKYFMDTAMLINGICCKILQSGWFLDVDRLKKVLSREVKINTVFGGQCGERVSEWHQKLKTRLQGRVRGHHQAIDFVADAVLRSIDLSSDLPSRPAGAFLVMGLTDDGRAKLVNMLENDLQADNGTSMLIKVKLTDNIDSRSQPFTCSFGSTVFEDSNILKAVEMNPYSVLLFELIENADASVFSTLLRILDTGMWSSGPHRMIDFRRTIIIMMTNLGNTGPMAELFGCSIADHNLGHSARKGSRHFRSELLNRLDSIIIFNPASHEQRLIIESPLKWRNLVLRLLNFPPCSSISKRIVQAPK